MKQFELSYAPARQADTQMGITRSAVANKIVYGKCLIVGKTSAIDLFTDGFCTVYMKNKSAGDLYGS